MNLYCPYTLPINLSSQSIKRRNFSERCLRFCLVAVGASRQIHSRLFGLPLFLLLNMYYEEHGFSVTINSWTFLSCKISSLKIAFHRARISAAVEDCPDMQINRIKHNNSQLVTLLSCWTLDRIAPTTKAKIELWTGISEHQSGYNTYKHWNTTNMWNKLLILYNTLIIDNCSVPTSNAAFVWSRILSNTKRYSIWLSPKSLEQV